MDDRAGGPKATDPQRPVREVSTDRWKIRLDLSEQVLGLDIPDDSFEGWHGRGRSQQPPLLPTLPAAPGFVPAALLLMKAKQFDDGLYAAIELTAQHGAGPFPGKAYLLSTLADRLVQVSGQPSSPAVAVLLGACELGGLLIPSVVERTGELKELIEKYLADARLSKPIGFYTWTSDLEKIFRQDRLLQTPLTEPKAWSEVCDVLQQNSRLRDTYATYLNFLARLTNPLRENDLRGLVPGSQQARLPDTAEGWSFFPPSRSRETDIFEQMYRFRPVPDGFDLMEELIRRVRQRTITFRPTPQSGWYDYQSWSLEPLLIPDETREAKRLQLQRLYRRHLVKLFKGILALSRETHAKQFGGGGRGGYGGEVRETIWIKPDLSVEPLATCYLRRAIGYRFIRETLEAMFGGDALAGIHRLTPDGPTPMSLPEELDSMESLFAGAYVTACRQLGLDPEPEPILGTCSDRDHAVTRFAQWAGQLGADTDVARDARMMMPVFFDEERRKTKVWIFLGWTQSSLSVSFVKPPRVVSCDRRGVPNPKVASQPPDVPPIVGFSSVSQELFTPVVAEVYVSQILNREEFRKHCDHYRTKAAILAHLR